MPLPVSNPKISVSVLCDDGEILAVEKESGRVTMPGRGHERDSVQNAVMAFAGSRLRHLGEGRDYGLLHRLDRATSGILLFAQTKLAYDTLREMFQRREVEKRYLAVTAATPPREKGTVRAGLSEVRSLDRKVVRGDARGKDAVTHYEVRERGRDGVALVECRIETGRLHQIRAHLSAIGAPLLGDSVYSGRVPDGRASAAREADRRVLLHAWRLAFDHPSTGKRVRYAAPIPDRFRSRCADLGLTLARV